MVVVLAALVFLFKSNSSNEIRISNDPAETVQGSGANTPIEEPTGTTSDAPEELPTRPNRAPLTQAQQDSNGATWGVQEPSETLKPISQLAPEIPPGPAM